ncbi:hypothetical protein GmRootA79_43260 [Acidovorax sp. A79]
MVISENSIAQLGATGGNPRAKNLFTGVDCRNMPSAGFAGFPVKSQTPDQGFRVLQASAAPRARKAATGRIARKRRQIFCADMKVS